MVQYLPQNEGSRPVLLNLTGSGTARNRFDVEPFAEYRPRLTAVTEPEPETLRS